MRYLAGLAALLCSLPAVAQNAAPLALPPAVRQHMAIGPGAPLTLGTPRVTIKAEQALLSTVLAEIEKQTGVRIYHPFANRPDEPLVSVEAQNAPLRAVVREIATQVGCYVAGTGRTAYILREGHNPRELAPSTTAGPYTLRIRSIQISDLLNLDFMTTAEQPMRIEQSMSISLEIEADDDLDLARVFAVHPNVRAVDDRGRTIIPKQTELPEWHSPPYTPSYGEWMGAHLQLARAERDATTIASLEGELLAYPEARVGRLVLALDDPQATATDAGYTLSLIEAGVEEGGNYRVKVKFAAAAPAGDDRPPVRRPNLPPQGDERLEAADGTPIRLRGSRIRAVSSIRTGEAPEETREYEWQFDMAPGQTPARFVYEFIARSGEPQPLTYRFESVPLPTWQE
jgi:hypothetical protein